MELNSMIKNNLRRTVTKRNKNKFSFVADTKIIFGYNFVAPLKISQFHRKTLVLEPPTVVFSCKICEKFWKILILKNICKRLLLDLPNISVDELDCYTAKNTWCNFLV